jgi:transcriptional regulator with GAF, ATPase, and Fis domain
MTTPENADLAKCAWRNWVLLAFMSLITVLGLATAIPPLMGEDTMLVWPWAKTDLALLGGLSITVLVFVGYLTQQQRRVMAMSRQLQQLQEEKKERMKRQTKRLYVLLNIGRIMESEADIQHVLDRITKVCVEAFGCHQASFMLFDEQAGELEVRSASGHSYMTKYIGARQKLGEGIAGWAAEHRRALLLGEEIDLKKFAGLRFEPRQIKAAMVVPVVKKDGLIGILNVSTRSPYDEYDEEDLHALQVFAENAGICINYANTSSHTRQLR